MEDHIWQVAFWVITGLGGLMVAVIGYGLKNWKTVIEGKIDEALHELKTISSATISQQGRIDAQDDRIRNNENRLNDHSKRLRNLEISSAKK